ncbi:MAG: FtsW/RodA/SpoVE family cell cycle protein [Clostridiales bacterium]|nr:FtsW/RodA/SpoVE family cell cycle protein [Clostridiales bacterium]
MPNDYSSGRRSSSGNKPPNKIPPRDANRRGESYPPVNKISHKKIKREPSYAPARKKLYLLGHDGDIDRPFFAILLVLLVFGITMMFSASYFWAIAEEGDGYFYLKRQLMAAALGFVGMILISKVDYHFLQNTKVAFIAFGAVLTLNLYTAFFGYSVAGAKRWIILLGQNFQPSEILKVTFIVIFAYLLSCNYPKFKDWRYSILPFVIVLGAVAVVLVLQRHMSAIVLVGIIGLGMMFIGGIPHKYFWRLVCVIAGAGLLLVIFKMITSTGSDSGFGYITKRIQGWRDPSSDIQGTTHQIWNSLISIGSGGVFGLGFGESKQKFLWLSESQNDFVFAIVCEELGLIGALFVIVLFCLFIYRGFHIASKSPDRFGMLLAAGITIQIGIQALFNIAVATNAIPNTGISLPFFSYGGTALVIQLCEMGLLLSVSRKTS